MIEIKNIRSGAVRDHDINVYVGRGIAGFPFHDAYLGNPFVVGVHGRRDECCWLYRNLLIGKLTSCKGVGFSDKELEKLRIEHRAAVLTLREMFDASTQKMVLWCWCAPAACHAETIRHAILNRKKQ